jgi:hypothetical protein
MWQICNRYRAGAARAGSHQCSFGVAAELRCRNSIKHKLKLALVEQQVSESMIASEARKGFQFRQG